MTHTPGPWIVENEKWVRTIKDGAIADVYDGKQGLHYDDAATEANARLIAAAPEMLEALKAAKPFFDEDFPDGADGQCAVTVEYHNAYKAMIAAIAKATGEA